MIARRFGALRLLVGIAAASGCGSPSQAEAPALGPTAQPQPAAASCGGKGEADCPLQNWMKATLQSYQREKNFTRLASALDELAGHAPDGYARWSDLARSGAAAARSGDEAGVRQSCKLCHDEHRARFRRERRGQPLF